MRSASQSCSALPPPHATLASKRPATALPGPDLHRLIAPALPGAFFHSITSSARASRIGGTSRPSPCHALLAIDHGHMLLGTACISNVSAALKLRSPGAAPL